MNTKLTPLTIQKNGKPETHLLPLPDAQANPKAAAAFWEAFIQVKDAQKECNGVTFFSC